MSDRSIETPPDRGPAVVVDTDVYSRVVLPGRGRAAAHPARADWQEVLMGHRLLIAVQTRVELLSMPLLSKNPWSETRVMELDDHIAGLSVLQVTDEVQTTFVTLTGSLRAGGHALGDKIHTGDRWIAATALAHGLPIASMDGIFAGIPGIQLIRPDAG